MNTPQNVYIVRLVKAVKVETAAPMFGRESNHLYVIASSFAACQEAVSHKYPDAEIRGIDLANYTGVPIVVGN